MISKLNHAYSGFFIWFLHCCVLLFVNVLFTLMDIYTLLRLSVELLTINVVVVLCAIGVDGLNAGNLRATIGLRLVFGERPTVEVSRNQNGILVFVHV